MLLKILLRVCLLDLFSETELKGVFKVLGACLSNIWQ